MRTINYESDFKIRESRKDGTPMWNSPFIFTYYVKKAINPFTVSYDGKEFVNCHKGKGEDEGKLIVAFDNPKFGPGVLRVKREFFLTDSDFADGTRHYVSDEATNVMLDKGATNEGVVVDVVINPSYYKGDKGDDGASAYQVWLDQGNVGSVEDFFESLRGEVGEAGASIEKIEQTTKSDDDNGTNVITITLTNGDYHEFYIRNGSKGDKGDTFTYDDLTQAQKEDLARQIIGDAEDERRAAEIVRQAKEQQREANEQGRISAEAEREAKEALREEQEAIRQQGYKEMNDKIVPIFVMTEDELANLTNPVEGAIYATYEE